MWVSSQLCSWMKLPIAKSVTAFDEFISACWNGRCWGTKSIHEAQRKVWRKLLLENKKSLRGVEKLLDLARTVVNLASLFHGCTCRIACWWHKIQPYSVVPRNEKKFTWKRNTVFWREVLCAGTSIILWVGPIFVLHSLCKTVVDFH